MCQCASILLQLRATQRGHGLLRHCVNGPLIPNDACLIGCKNNNQSLIVVAMNLLDQTSNGRKKEKKKQVQTEDDIILYNLSVN